jgi:PilZ domain
MAQEPNDSISYLVGLKQTSSGAAPAPAREPIPRLRESPSAPVAATAHEVVSGAEKRRSPRYKCEGSAEMRQEGADLRTWATFTDINLHGCYVGATASYPVGTRLQVKLEAKGMKVQAKGTVRVSYPHLGMGIAFTEISPENRSQLLELLRLISRPAVILGSGANSTAPILRQSMPWPPITNMEAGLKAIVHFFDEQPMLTRDEFSRLLRKSQE